MHARAKQKKTSDEKIINCWCGCWRVLGSIKAGEQVNSLQIVYDVNFCKYSERAWVYFPRISRGADGVRVYVYIYVYAVRARN